MRSQDVHRRTGRRSLPVALTLAGALLSGVMLALAIVLVGVWASGALYPAPVSAHVIAQTETERVAIGHDLVVKSDEQVHGDVSVTNGSLTVLGMVYGNVTVVNGNADIQGKVTGDVTVTNGNVRLASGSSVGGNVVAVTGKVVKEEAASVGGTVSALDISIPDLGGSVRSPLSSVANRASPDTGRENNPFGRFAGFMGWGMVGLLVMALGVLAALLMPARVRVAADTMQMEPGPSVVVGVIVALLFMPVIAVLGLGLAISVVGVVLIPVVVIAAQLLLILGLVVMSVALGRRMLVADTARPNGPDGATTNGYRPTSIVLQAALGMAVILSSTFLPAVFVADWVKVILLALVFFACCLGLGALLLSRFGTLAPRAARRQAQSSGSGTGG